MWNLTNKAYTALSTNTTLLANAIATGVSSFIANNSALITASLTASFIVAGIALAVYCTKHIDFTEIYHTIKDSYNNFKNLVSIIKTDYNYFKNDYETSMALVLAIKKAWNYVEHHNPDDNQDTINVDPHNQYGENVETEACFSTE